MEKKTFFILFFIYIHIIFCKAILANDDNNKQIESKNPDKIILNLQKDDNRDDDFSYEPIKFSELSSDPIKSGWSSIKI